MAENFGMKVTFILDTESDAGRFKIQYRNVTEVHYNYNRNYSAESNYRTAFESDIHSTGNTWFSAWIKEMEIVAETEVQEKFENFANKIVHKLDDIM